MITNSTNELHDHPWLMEDWNSALADLRAGPSRWLAWRFSVTQALLGFGGGRAAPAHAWYRRFWWAAIRRERGTFAAFCAVLDAPRRIAIEAREAVETYGPLIEQTHRVSVSAQYRHLMMLGLAFGVDPTSYYTWGLFARERRRNAGDFVHRREANLLYQLLASREAMEDFAILADKRKFARWCETHGLPGVPILAAFEDGRMSDGERDLVLPDADVFSKPATAYGGDGARRWRRSAHRTWTHQGRDYDERALLDALVTESRDRTIILQECVRNDESVLPLASVGLCTVRLVTVRSPDGTVELISSTYRMSVNGSSTDNLTGGGIAAEVDLETGQLGAGMQFDAACMSVAHVRHPTTGVMFQGWRLPYWEAATSLVLHAHGCFRTLACAGWDVALTPDGPVLIESNFAPGVDLPQAPSGMPLGQTTFVRHLDAHLRRSFARSA